MSGLLDGAETPGHYLYVLRCADGTLYTGYTVHVARRLATHQSGKGARYTRARLPVSLVGWWGYPDQRSAMQAEYAFKRLSRAEKLRLIGTATDHSTPTAAWQV